MTTTKNNVEDVKNKCDNRSEQKFNLYKNGSLNEKVVYEMKVFDKIYSVGVLKWVTERV